MATIPGSMGPARTPEEDQAHQDLVARSQRARAAAPQPEGLFALHSTGIGAAVQRRLAAPPEPADTSSWSAWATTKAFGTGPVAGGLEYAGSVADLASGSPTPLASTGGSAGGMFALASDDERRQEDEARQRMLKGPVFDTTMGNVMRAKAREFEPDPITSHRSAQIIHGLTSSVSKAAASVATLGGLPGAVVFGLEEGNTAAQNLITEGVDPATAAKVGVVTAVTSGVGVALPVAGTTVAKTLGLVAAGGPGSYIAQEALSREILQEAGYTAQAEMHDPTDPVMLALSIAAPGVGAGFHLRGQARARGAQAAMKAATERLATEQDVRALADAAGVEVPRGEIAITEPRPAGDSVAAVAARNQENVDAARVAVLDAAEGRHIPADALTRAEPALAAVRESVESGDMLPLHRLANEQTDGAPQATQAAPLRFTTEMGSTYEFDGTSTTRNKAARDTPGHEGDSGLKEPSVRTVFLDDSPASLSAAGLQGVGDKGARLVIRDGKATLVTWNEAQGRWGAAESARDIPFHTEPAVGRYPLEVWDQRSDVDGMEAYANQHAGNRIVSMETSGRDAGGPDAGARADADPAGIRQQPDPMPGTKAESDAAMTADGKPILESADDGDARVAAAVDELAAADPDMLVTLPGSEKPIRLSEALEQIKRDAEEMRQDADFVSAAANCFLMSGV